MEMDEKKWTKTFICSPKEQYIQTNYIYQVKFDKTGESPLQEMRLNLI